MSNARKMEGKDTLGKVCTCCRAVSPQHVNCETVVKRKSMRGSALPGHLAPVRSTYNARRRKLSAGKLGEATNTDLNLLQTKNAICKTTLDVQGNGQCTHIGRRMKHVNSETIVQRDALFSYVQKWISLVLPHRQLSREMQSRGGARISTRYDNVQSVNSQCFINLNSYGQCVYEPMHSGVFGSSLLVQ